MQRKSIFFAVITARPDGEKLNYVLHYMYTRLNELEEHLEKHWKGYEYKIDVATLDKEE